MLRDLLVDAPRDLLESDPRDLLSPSILDQIKEHPFKTILQPVPKTLGGKSPSEVIFSKFGEKSGGESYIPAFLRAFGAGVAGDVADIATSPISYIPIPAGKLLGKIPIAKTTLGEIVSKIPVGKGFINRVSEMTGDQAGRDLLEPITQILQKSQLQPSQLNPLENTLSTSISKSIPQELSPVNKITQVLKEAKSIRGKQELIYSSERAKRAGAISGIGQEMGGEQTFVKQLGALKGELPKVQFEGIRSKIAQPDIDSLFNTIEQHQTLTPFDKITAKNGLAKLLGTEGGTVPTKGELNLLGEVFPQDFIKTVLDKRPLMQKLGEGVESIINVPRAIMASIDLSAPFRQGVFLIGRPKQWLPAFGNMFKYAFSEKSYQGLMESIAKRPTYPLMREARLPIMDLGSTLTNREEKILSNLPEKIPLIGKFFRGSNRAYTGFLNKLRADVFDDLVKTAQENGIKVEGKVLNDIGMYIGSATGRGKLPAVLEQSAPTLNAIFFSPRLMASRINLLNPEYYIKLDPFVRKQALKDLLKFSGTALTILSLAKMGGAKVGDEPTSADFGKIRFGNTRYDIGGGFQQYLVAGARLKTNEIINSTTGVKTTLGEGYKPTTRADVIARFIISKENPIASFATALLQNRNTLGQKLDIPKEIGMRFVPMVIQDMYDLYKERGLEGIGMATPGIFGVGVQTYSPTASETVYSANSVLKNYTDLLKQGRMKEAVDLVSRNKDIIRVGKSLEPIQKGISLYEGLKDTANKSVRLTPDRRKELLSQYDEKIKELNTRLESEYKRLK